MSFLTVRAFILTQRIRQLKRDEWVNKITSEWGDSTRKPCCWDGEWPGNAYRGLLWHRNLDLSGGQDFLEETYPEALRALGWVWEGAAGDGEWPTLRAGSG